MTSFKSLLRPLAPRVYRGIERTWGSGFRLAGRRQADDQQRVRAVDFTGGQRIVIIAPHPDDETIAAGGTALRHRQACDEVRAVIVTDGRSSRAGGLSGDAMAECRRKEARAASHILDIDLCWLGLPEDFWDDQTARAALAPLLTGAQIIYAPSCIDFHPGHLRVAALLSQLLRSDQTVRIMELGVPLTGSLVNRVADIAVVAPQKRQALRAYASQAGALAPLQRLADYRSRYYRQPAVEVFWETSGENYRRIITAGDWRQRRRCPFRGVRSQPLSDPLAWLFGRAERRRLKQMNNE